jgi:hypothetical protein
MALLLVLFGCSDETTIVWVDPPPEDDGPTTSPVPVEPPPEPLCAAKPWSVAVNAFDWDRTSDIGVSPDCLVAFSGTIGFDAVIGGMQLAEGANAGQLDADGAPQWAHLSSMSDNWVRARFDRSGNMLMLDHGFHELGKEQHLGSALTKLDPSGVVTWRNLYKTTGQLHLASAGVDGIVMAGRLNAAFALDDEIVVPEGEVSSFIALLDADGRRLHTTVLSEVTLKFAEGDWWGNVHALVTTTDSTTIGSESIGSDQTALVVVDPAGTLSMTSWATAAFTVYDLAVDQNGRVVLAGRFEGNAVIGGTAIAASAVTVVALDETGAYQWHTTLPDGGLTVAIDDRGHVYVAHQEQLLTIHQFDDSGTLVASTDYPGGSSPEAMVAAPAGGVVLSGEQSGGSVDFGTGVMQMEDMHTDIWVASLPPAL